MGTSFARCNNPEGCVWGVCVVDDTDEEVKGMRRGCDNSEEHFGRYSYKQIEDGREHRPN